MVVVEDLEVAVWGDGVGWEELSVLVCAVFSVGDLVLGEECLGEVF